ncbi:phage tail sheath subtilisin-like domain-containing protein [Sphingomonas sp. CARO-RG-8B-R24-01]|uniref:phage tail sheath subtilisin-like domain-containing protein n=1 Tax=Sphingomonas sp. CARO-RG-8B-R24-01 TaxID=2914831 RepID=UPI001F5600E7|nr:phage tail sheath subtilisin-like domain-containing protein [Sphingomonas sp. CARO-RG-8B-R24-01]
MTISFKQIPSGLRLPGFYAELDASQANTASGTQRALIIGQITGAATLAPNVPVLSTSASEARVAGGAGSVLAAMVAAYRANDAFGEVWYLPVSDDPAAIAATGSFTFSGPSTAAGVLNLYIAGQVVAVAVTAGMSAAQLATAAIGAIGAAVDLPVTAVVDGAVAAKVNLTAKNKGAVGNDIDLRINFLGTAGGQVLPAGTGVTVAPMGGGATNPTLTTALAALGTLPFDFIVSPFTDAASIAAVSGLLSDATGRWSWQTEIFGHCFIAKRGTQGALATFGTGLNDQHLSCMGFNDSPTPNYVWAAAVAGAVAPSVRTDPATPLQTLTVAGVLAPPVQSRFLPSQRNTLLYDGISTFRTDPAGAVQIENLITTYQANAQGQADNAYLEAETMFSLMAVLRSFAGLFSSKFARVKLGTDGVRYPAGSNVVTPSTIAAEMVALYRSLEDAGLVQNSNAFAAGLSVTKNAQNAGRVDTLAPITLIGQLRTVAMQLQFKLS